MRSKEKWKPVKQTKRLQEFFDRYSIALRDKPISVMHATYKTVTEVPPLEFAVFELVIKAQFILWQDYHENRCWIQAIAANNGIELVESDDMPKANEAYLYGLRLLQDAGFYYDLLD